MMHHNHSWDKNDDDNNDGDEADECEAEDIADDAGDDCEARYDHRNSSLTVDDQFKY